MRSAASDQTYGFRLRNSARIAGDKSEVRGFQSLQSIAEIEQTPLRCFLQDRDSSRHSEMPPQRFAPTAHFVHENCVDRSVQGKLDGVAFPRIKVA